MSSMTPIQNFRTNRKIEQEKVNAAQVAPSSRTARLPVWGVPFALAFVFMLVAVTAPASASVLNLSNIKELLTDFIGIIPTFMDLMIAYAPLAICGAIVSAIVMFPKKILDMFNSFF